MQELKGAIKGAAKELFGEDIEPELERPDEKFGDYSTNAAMQLGKKLGKNPKEVAIALASKLHGLDRIGDVNIAGPGFINVKLTDEFLLGEIKKASESFGKNNSFAGQTIVLEHTDPNPFKEFHIGHAYSNTIGVAIGKLMENAAAKVHQVSYHGDVGLHIAMAIYGVKNSQSSSDLGVAYAFGANAYKNDSSAKQEIEKINAEIYSKTDPEVNKLYDEGRRSSLEAFGKIYEKLGTSFERNYFESETAGEGIELVQKNLNKVFQESDGAIIYDGEKVGLHKRVFITKQNLPTYEAKEIGLAFAKQRDYPEAQSFIVITANEIDDYFKVLVAAIKEIDKQLGEKIKHRSHGMVKFAEGKMSSRTGNVKLLSDLEVDIENKANQMFGGEKVSADIVYGAIKYEFLKHRMGSDFIFDVEESVSLQGNSGPYLQYAHARARSILAKSRGKAGEIDRNLEKAERSLARKISEYPEVVQKATNELMPHYISNYLYDLAQNFNSFYEDNRVIGDKRQPTRINLVSAYAQALKNGLSLLNIAAPEHM